VSVPGRKRRVVLAGALAILCVAPPGWGVVIGFSGITLNNPAHVAAGEQQLWMEVRLPQEAQVEFTFHNTGDVSSVITEVCFEQGPLETMISVNSSSDALFLQDNRPKNLPGGNGLVPAFDAAFSMGADNPAQSNGVINDPLPPGGWVSALFRLQGGATYQTVLQQLEGGQLRVGVRVQGFAAGGNESFVNMMGSPAHQPEPATLAFGLAGVCVALLSRLIRTARPQLR
jgi:hypothetical protein